MSDLASKSCTPCKSGTPPLRGAALRELAVGLAGWEVVGEQRLVKEYKFPNFITALAFVKRVGEVAEREGHHPDIQLGWGRVRIELWTHSINGLSESDFILAAKCDAAL